MAKKPIPLADRFWAKVDKTGECWLWRGALQGGRVGPYGLIWGGPERGKYVYAHRVAYELQHGPIPPGMDVCHDCPGGDNRLCMRGSHLFLGTHEDNFIDMRAKGRHSRGETHWRARLTEVDVRRIRERSREETRTAIAESYGVSVSLVSLIVLRKVWAHVA